MKRIFCIAALCTVLLVQASWASNFADTYGYSATGIAMGNSITAIVSDWSSVFYNIAGLGRTRGDGVRPIADNKSTSLALLAKKGKNDKVLGESEPETVTGGDQYVNQLAFSMFYTQPKFKIDIAREGVKGDEQLQFGMFVIGLAIDINKIYTLPRFISSARFGLGLSSLSDGYASRINDIDLKTHNFMRYGREAQKAVIIAGLGFGFLDDAVGIGAGANMNFKGEGKVLISDVQVGPVEQTPEAQSRTDLKAAPALVAGIYVSPGKIINPLKGLDVGASYRQESYMELFPFQTSTSMLVGGMEMSMNMAIFENYTPHIFTGGIAYTRSRFTLSLAAEYQVWSKYKFSKTIEIVYADAVANRTNGEDYRLPKFKDIIIPRVGVSYDAFRWMTVMAGYYYQPTFIPDDQMQGRLNLLDNTMHVGSFGMKFGVPRMGGMGGPLDIILSGQYQYLVEREVVKTHPDPVWNPNYTYGGVCYSAMMEVRMRL
jgi:long-chain fatty acid transport protein